MPQARYDPESIRKLFDDMASTYGRVNLISSFGFTARWRRQSVRGLPLASVGCVVDLMSGMGELWHSLAPYMPASARIVGVDISLEMTQRARREWHFPVEVCVVDVLEWRPDAAFADIIVSSFGLKTFDHEQQALLAQTVARILKPGGVCSFIEISVPKWLLLRAPFMFYLKRVIPIIGRALLGNPNCYRMLGVYAENFGNSGYFADCLRSAGLEAKSISLFFGCATGVRAIKCKAT